MKKILNNAQKKVIDSSSHKCGLRSLDQVTFFYNRLMNHYIFIFLFNAFIKGASYNLVVELGVREEREREREIHSYLFAHLCMFSDHFRSIFAIKCDGLTN